MQLIIYISTSLVLLWSVLPALTVSKPIAAPQSGAARIASASAEQGFCGTAHVSAVVKQQFTSSSESAAFTAFVEPTWTEAAAAYGIDVGGRKEGGLSFYDFDNDGDLDLLVNTFDTIYNSRLLQRMPNGTYQDVTASLAPGLLVQRRERSVVWGDLNNDGYVDFVRNTGDFLPGAGIEIYFQHPATSRFGNGLGGTVPIGVGENASYDVYVKDGMNTEGLGLADFDGDGDLDIIFDNHDYGIDVLRNNLIDHNSGARTGLTSTKMFEHATPRNGNSVVLGLNQVAVDGDYGAFVDINDDGWIDIFMRKRDQNDFFLNIGGSFSNGQDLGQAFNHMKGSNAIYDFDNDGDFDIFWTENGDNQIFRNDLGTWVPLGSSGSTNIPTSFTSTITEAAGGDYDNDGDVDLLLVGNNRSFLFKNLLNDPLLGADVGTPMAFELVDSEYFNRWKKGFAAQFIDIDDDGDLDIYINTNTGNRLFLNGLYSASTPANDINCIRVRTWDDRAAYMDSGTERPALGTTVLLTDCEGVVLSGMREVSGGNSRGTQNPHDVHFGLTHGRNYNYQIVVKYPAFRLANGSILRTVIRKTFNPAEHGATIPVLEFRPDDPSIACLAVSEDCSNGIDDDGDGLIDCADDDCPMMSIEHRIQQVKSS